VLDAKKKSACSEHRCSKLLLLHNVQRCLSMWAKPVNIPVGQRSFVSFGTEKTNVVASLSSSESEVVLDALHCSSHRAHSWARGTYELPCPLALLCSPVAGAHGHSRTV
jgi:hypothetical protein